MCHLDKVDGGDLEEDISWILASVIRDIPPGEKCQIWWPFVKVKHFLREKHTQHSRKYTDGNPWGFWKEFGETERYSASQGTTPFDKMLNEILGGSSTSSTTQVVASDDAAPVVPPSPRKPAALAPHLRRPAFTTQVVVSDDTAPVLLPHLRKPTSLDRSGIPLFSVQFWEENGRLGDHRYPWPSTHYDVSPSASYEGSWYCTAKPSPSLMPTLVRTPSSLWDYNRWRAFASPLPNWLGYLGPPGQRCLLRTWSDVDLSDLQPPPKLYQHQIWKLPRI